MASLPNEVLMLVFGFAAPPGGRDSSKQAIWLSHVSRRFRRVALGTQSIWTTLDGHISTEGLQSFHARSGKNSDLHVIVYASLDNDDLHYFLDMCLKLAPRWATLLVTSGRKEGDFDTCTVENVLDELFDCPSRKENVYSFPRLRSLRVEEFRTIANTEFEAAESEYKPKWMVPYLRKMECDEYIPIPSSAYSSVDTFSASFSIPITTFPGVHFKALRNLLPSLQALTTLDMTIRTSARVTNSYHFFRIECPSVSSLTLNFPSFALPEALVLFLGPFMASLVMPQLIEYSVSFEVDIRDDSDTAEGDFEDLMSSAFLDPIVHTKLTSISVNISLTEGAARTRYNKSFEPIEIPLYCIRHASEMSIRTPFAFTVVAPDQLGEEISLKELRLECNQFDAESLEKLITSLREANIWDTLVAFKMENCGHSLEYKDVVEIVGEEKLSFSKSRTIGF